MTTRTINRSKVMRLHKLICDSIFTILPPLAPNRITHAFQVLVKSLESIETDESIWYIGESEYATLDALVVGAYWYYSDHYAGQNCENYATLCALGRIFSPGMTSLDEDSTEYDVYTALADYCN